MDVELLAAAVALAGAVITAAWLIRRRPQPVETVLEAPPLGPSLPDFEAMSIDALGEWKRRRRDAGGEYAKAEIREANAVQDRKIMDWHVEEARKQIQIAAGRREQDPGELAREWLTSDQIGRRVQARLYLGLPRIGRE